MGFADLYRKRTEPHVDTPDQAKARADAAARVKAKGDAAHAAAEKAARKEKAAPAVKAPTKE